jgi:hypothetical protein
MNRSRTAGNLKFRQRVSIAASSGSPGSGIRSELGERHVQTVAASHLNGDGVLPAGPHRIVENSLRITGPHQHHGRSVADGVEFVGAGARIRVGDGGGGDRLGGDGHVGAPEACGGGLDRQDDALGVPYGGD